jgi:hypothetical protein
MTRFGSPRVRDVVAALDRITGGRVVEDAATAAAGAHPFVIRKTSGIPGKDILEIPGLIVGDPDRPVRKLAVAMTLDEVGIELAGATGVDCLVAHHPVADAASAGGVTLREYLSLYDLAVIELHEAFHGLHPGIPWLHGHRPVHVDIAFGGRHGNVVLVGEALPEVRTAGDLLDRLARLMSAGEREQALRMERALWGSEAVQEAECAARPHLLVGARQAPVRKVLHVFPHTGFSPHDLVRSLTEHPDIDTLVASISRVRPDHGLVAVARERGLSFVVGNSHASEIVENGLPLARALAELLPGTEIVVFHKRVISIPLADYGRGGPREDYGRRMAGDLVRRAQQRTSTTTDRATSTPSFHGECP